MAYLSFFFLFLFFVLMNFILFCGRVYNFITTGIAQSTNGTALINLPSFEPLGTVTKYVTLFT